MVLHKYLRYDEQLLHRGDDAFGVCVESFSPPQARAFRLSGVSRYIDALGRHECMLVPAVTVDLGDGMEFLLIRQTVRSSTVGSAMVSVPAARAPSLPFSDVTR